MISHPELMDKFDTLDKAKAAAQSDFNTRIRSALSRIPASRAGEPAPDTHEEGGR
jgi:hypothetical protein